MLHQNKIFEIHRLKSSGESERKIAKILNVGRGTVSKYLKHPLNISPPIRKRKSKLDDYSNHIDYLITTDPNIKKSSIHHFLMKNGYNGSYSSVRRYLSKNYGYLSSKKGGIYCCDIENIKQIHTNDKIGYLWVLKLLQGAIPKDELIAQYSEMLSIKDISKLYDSIINGHLRFRNRAITLFLYLNGVSQREIAKFLFLSRGPIKQYIRKFKTGGIDKLFNFKKDVVKKSENPKYKERLFSILHSPPISYGINRTTWRIEDLKNIMKENGFEICRHNIRKIIKDAGYRYSKARKVLTSNDPEYKNKLKIITAILSNLKGNEKFFSIDEFGPFAIKIRGGRSLTKKGEIKTIPQFQKSKGSLIVTGALELSTNQVVHFYSNNKNTDEMLKLIGLLIDQYRNEKTIYISWDAASWHASKDLYRFVKEINKSNLVIPNIELAPLPSSAQFLNVIESIYSGMARAIIHNSNYKSVNDCKRAIDRYFFERNTHFLKNPKRAGNKIWGKERVIPKFSESNNCKDPMFR